MNILLNVTAACFVHNNHIYNPTQQDQVGSVAGSGFYSSKVNIKIGPMLYRVPIVAKI